MVQHIVMWSFKDEIPADERKEILARAKEALEALVGEVPGLVSARVVTETLSSGTHDFALFTELETPEALSGYAVHPKHQEAANTFVRPYTCNRAALDFLI